MYCKLWFSKRYSTRHFLTSFARPYSQLSTKLRAKRSNTAGTVLRVKSIRIEPHRVVFTGSIPSTALVFERPAEIPSYIKARSIGNLHLIGSSLHSVTGDEIGFLVLQTPVAAVGLVPESDDGDSCWVALAVKRTIHNLPPSSIGAVSCARCNRPIAQQRLLAVPNTKVCTSCQKKKEKR